MLGRLQTKKIISYISVHTLLAIIYFFACKAIIQAYPIPHISWDSNYYVRAAFFHDFRLRPSGYPFFLQQLGDFAPGINHIVFAQFTLHFCSCIFLLYSINRIFRFQIVLYTLLGVAILLEPVTLYHSNSILSDQLFSSLTILALGTLLLYTHTRKYLWFLLHVCLVFMCIEVRHIGLFYPFFSCFILLLFSTHWKVTTLNVAILISAFFILQKWHVNDNIRTYSSAVYSPFSGWTLANNALYCLKTANVNLDDIKEEDMRNMYQYMNHSLDSTGLINQHVGSEYLWNEKSPLSILRNKTIDSLYPHLGYNTSWHVSWYVLAPRFEQFGKHFQQHYPFAYLKSYILPNIQTLLIPHTGEMADYYVPPVNDSVVLARYGLSEEEIRCNAQPYKNWLNNLIEKGYFVILVLFICSIFVFVYTMRDFEKEKRNAAIVILVFLLMFYGTTLYSSWFMCRYLLPAYICTFVFLTIIVSHLLRRIKSMWVKNTDSSLR